MPSKEKTPKSTAAKTTPKKPESDGLKLSKAPPPFKAFDEQEKLRSLKDYLGSWLVLYFYPKDLTPGCTTEAQEFSELYSVFSKLNCAIVGISPDAPKIHTKFIQKYDLPFSLLSDADHKIAERYGIWVEKSMYGRTYMGILRSTFLIDPKGKLYASWLKVSPKGHANEVLNALKEAQK